MGIVNDSNLLYISLVGESDTQSERSHTVTTPRSRRIDTIVVPSNNDNRRALMDEISEIEGVMRVDTAKNGELHVKLKPRLVPSVRTWTEQAIKAAVNRYSTPQSAAARKHDPKSSYHNNNPWKGMFENRR